MMTNSPDKSDHDIELFRRSIGEVKKIKQDTIVPEKSRPLTRRMQVNAGKNKAEDGVETDVVGINDALLFTRPGIQRQVFKNLRRGNYKIESELDMHGMNVNSAREALSGYLAQCRNKQYRCIRIIHGKGYGSENGIPVLKNKLNTWLKAHDDVLAFCSAQPSDGGLGAIYVLIKKH